ncbi:hypothetical protein J1D01_09045 [Seonamhaeicola sp. NFXS20]|uniref:hypothetical protein n=1 Tax=unclassified Seonamhaeicola TaxID=2622645 RepID=UPI003563FDCB
MEVIDKNEKVLNLSQQSSFKLTELKMDVKDNVLTVRLKAPLLSPNNYVVDVSDGILTLKVMLAKIETNYGEIKKKPIFVECFLVLPNSSFNSLLNSQYSNGGLYISIAQNTPKTLLSSDAITGIA